MVRFIFVTGGVVSSLGKGIASASIATLLQSRGYKVRIRKLDPYLNIDPGTMNPYEHGEVYVTEDGAETDLDLGHYERFTDINSKKSDNITTGKIYQNIITKERNGDYKGSTVQIIPHVTDEDLRCAIRLLHKGGDTSDKPSDWRPIGLLNVGTQLVHHVINYRLTTITEVENIGRITRIKVL